MNLRQAERESTFASGLNSADALAFDSAGDLFVACWGVGEFPPTGDGYITEITPGGAESTFATGLSSPSGLAFNSAGNLFEADYDSGNIYEFTPTGAKSTFASGLDGPMGLAFNGAGDLFVADGSATTLLKSLRAEPKAPSPPGGIILRWPSKAKPCLCLNRRLWDCWPSAFTALFARTRRTRRD